MPRCEVCGEEEYYEEDGLFFCGTCHTQSQSMVVMELDDSHMLSQRSFGATREIRGEKKSKQGRSEYEAGRPWTRYEAYQLILQGQADALIAHQGAHPSVKEAVQRLYFAYLAKLEVAFVGKDKVRLIPEGMERSEHTGWHRELHRGGMEKPEVNLKAMKRKLSKLQKSEDMDKLKEKESLSASLEEEAFYEGDNPLEEEDPSDEEVASVDLDLPLLLDSDDTSEVEEEEEDQDCWGSRKTRHSTPKSKLYRLGKQGVLCSIKYMNLRKTLAFIYSACLFSSRWITVSDILRWVRNGSLPYLETTHLLHSDMKLSAYDHHLFKPTKVTSDQLRLDAGLLLRFLDIEQLPAFLVEDTAIKYTLSLDLPEELVRCVVAAVRQCPVECSSRLGKDVYKCKSLPNVDALCAAYILVALKAMFGLDDHRERLLSDYTKEVQERVDVHLFDWQQWQQHATQKFLVKSGRVAATLGEEGQEMDEVEAVCTTFEKAQYKNQIYSHAKLYHKQKKAKVASFKQENREMLSRIASVLEERWKNRDATAARLRAEEEEEEHTGERSAMSPEEQAVQFSTSSIQHIIHAEDFLHTHLHQEKVSHTSASDGQPLARSNTPPSEFDAVFSTSATSPAHASTTLGSGFGLSATAGKKDGTEVRGKKRLCLDRESQQEEAEMERPRGVDDGQAGDGLTHLLELRSRVSEEYIVYPQQTGRNAYSMNSAWWSDQPSSYKWLLQVLSAVVCCPHTDIQRMVQQVEEGLGDGENEENT